MPAVFQLAFLHLEWKEKIFVHADMERETVYSYLVYLSRNAVGATGG